MTELKEGAICKSLARLTVAEANRCCVREAGLRKDRVRGACIKPDLPGICGPQVWYRPYLKDESNSTLPSNAAVAANS